MVIKPGTFVRWFALLALLLAAMGCGKGSDTRDPDTPPGSGNTLAGVAAAGAPVSGTVTLKDASATPRVLTTSTAGDGSFSFDVTGLTAPFLLRADGVSGSANHTLYSLSTAAGTCNITPLTNVALIMANGGYDPSAIFASPASSDLTRLATAFPSASASLRDTLDPLFDQVGATQENIVSDPFVADHTGLDQLLDSAVFTASDGNLTITNRASGAYMLAPTSMRGGVVSGPVSVSALSLYTISGTVVTSAGAPVSGATVTLTGSAPSKTTTSDPTGKYTFYGIAPGSYSVSAAATGYSFAPVTRTVVSTNLTGVTLASLAVTVPPSSLTISGRIATASGTPVSGVVISTGVTSVTSDSDGNYTVGGLADGSYTLTPSKSGYTFTPATTTVTLAGAGARRDFVATPTPSGYRVAGTVFGPGGTWLQGVTVTLSDGSGFTMSSTTDSYGRYQFQGVPNGTYTITPTLANYSFQPNNYAPHGYSTITVNGANRTGVDSALSFQGKPGYSISGNYGLNYVDVIYLYKADGTPIGYPPTNPVNGNYYFYGLPSGNYVLMGFAFGYASGDTFDPPYRNISITSENITGADFTPIPYSGYIISGKVTNSAGTGINGVTVTATGPNTMTTTTYGVGYYYMIIPTTVTSGTYSVTPSSPYYSFTPGSYSVPVSTSSSRNYNFTAR